MSGDRVVWPDRWWHCETCGHEHWGPLVAPCPNGHGPLSEGAAGESFDPLAPRVWKNPA